MKNCNSKLSILKALEYHGIEDVLQFLGESDFDCANRILEKLKSNFIVREDSQTKYIIFSRPSINAIAAKITIESSLDSLLMV
ncbi:hypothetical protein GW796_08330 [archaeon]|nr:hypothetical protein [archaeon]